MQRAITPEPLRLARHIRLSLFISTIAAVSLSPIANAQVSGEWKLGTYTWQASQSGNYVNGNYNSDEGRVLGTLSGRTLTGHWIEKSSNQKCKYPRDGSYYWGGLRLNYNPSFSTFEGSWGYCETYGYRKWSGRRIGGSAGGYGDLAGGGNDIMPVSTGYGGKWRVGNYIWDAQQSGNQLSGSYDSDDGRIIGTLTGNRFNGYWVEKSSGKKCSRAVDGSYFWGRTKWTYDAALKTFTGRWGYCEDNNYRAWEGRRLDTGGISQGISGDGFRISRIEPYFTIYNQPTTVNFEWIAPLPTSIRIIRYGRGIGQQTVYEGAPISSLNLQHGGLESGGRYGVWARSKYGRDDGPYQAVVIAPDNVRKY